MSVRRLRTLLGDYPVTAALKAGKLSSSEVAFDFADVAVPHTAFKRVVRSLEFEVAELALVTYLLARAHGKPLVLLPAVVTSRFQHPLLVCNAERGMLAPKELEGCRVGQRSCSVTTATWIRGLLQQDYGVDLARVRWVTFEDPHVAEVRDPPNAERAAPGKDMIAMLLAGELDAAILGEPPRDPRLKPVIADPDAAARDWCRRTGASLQINHMVVFDRTLPREMAEEAYRMLCKSRELAGNPPMNPFGIEENRANLEAAIDSVHRQGLIPRRFTVEELFQ